MSSLAELKVNDQFVVRDQQRRYQHRTVVKVARVWLTDDRGYKFRIADGEGEEREQFGHGYSAMTVAEWEIAEETERLKSRLLSWGWVPSGHGRSLTLAQMRRAAALISEFESENAGGLL